MPEARPVRGSVSYAYPWDFADDPDAADRAAGLGLDAVAVAAAYHAVRAGTPLHPRHRVFDVPDSAVYVPVRPDAWRGHRLMPATPPWDASGSSFQAAQRQLAERGLDVDAWLVLTHNDTLGRENPDLVVRNATGERYPYALCPSAPDVLEFCATLVEETLGAAPVDGVVVESCGPMGLDHGGVHDKTDLSGWDTASRALLSLCFCASCTEAYAGAGLDADELQRRVRDGLGSGVDTVQAALGDAATPVAAVRSGLAQRLRELVVERCTSDAPDARVTVHGSADPWATGSFATLQPAVGDGVDAVVASCWDVDGGAEQLAGLRELAPEGTAVGGYLKLDAGWAPGETTRRRLAEYRDAGMTELHLYHLGLLGERGLRDLRGVLDAARQLGSS